MSRSFGPVYGDEWFNKDLLAVVGREVFADGSCLEKSSLGWCFAWPGKTQVRPQFDLVQREVVDPLRFARDQIWRR